jgi:hypothetical protein
MATRILGPTGSKRRKRFLLVPILLVACTAMFVVGGAQAVHDSGVFQLDGNAVAGDNSTPAMPTATEDAGNICAAFAQTVTNPANPAGQHCNQPGAVAPGAATSSTRAAFVSDGNGQFPSGANDDIWTNGTKDDMNIEDWVYKNAASSNDKSDIENAFAAVYTAPANAPHEAGHKLIYFGGTRTSNNGSENTAFWFLQNPVSEHPNTASSCTLGGGCHFDGSHVAANPGADGCLTQGSLSIQMVTVGGVKAGTSPCTESDATADTGGDVLIVSAFSVGGTQPNTTAYEFVGQGAAPKAFCVTSKCSVLQITPVVSGCDPNFNDDPVCAITNQNIKYDTCPPASGNPPVLPPCVAGNAEPIPSPWIYSEKSSDSSTSGADKCTVAANHMCPGIYFEGGLDLTALGLGGECTSTFTMDTRSSGSVDASLQDLAIGQLGSCTSSLSTTPKNGAGDTTAPDDPANANALSIGTGTVNATDQAHITVQGTDTWSGTLKFYLCGPIPAGDTCDGTTHVGLQIGSTMNVNQDSGTSDGLVPPGRLILSSQARLTSAANKSTGAPGHYCWRGEFAATVNGNNLNKTDASSGECFVVNPVTPTLVTTAVDCTASHTAITAPVTFGSSVCDKGNLSGAATQPATNGPSSEFPSIFQAANPPIPNGAAAGGKITFTLRGPDTAGTPCSTATAAKSAGTNPEDVTVSGNADYFTTGVTPSAPGNYHWVAQYIPAAGPPADPNNIGSTHNNACGNSAEALTIQQIPTNINTRQSWFPNDTAQISAASGNLGDGGTVDFSLFADNTCTGTVLYSERVTLGSSLGTSTEASTSNYTGSSGVKPGGGTVSPFPVTTAYADPAGNGKGPYYWKVVYTPAAADAAHTGKQSDCSESHSYTYTNDNSGGTNLP